MEPDPNDTPTRARTMEKGSKNAPACIEGLPMAIVIAEFSCPSLARAFRGPVFLYNYNSILFFFAFEDLYAAVIRLETQLASCLPSNFYPLAFYTNFPGYHETSPTLVFGTWGLHYQTITALPIRSPSPRNSASSPLFLPVQMSHPPNFRTTFSHDLLRLVFGRRHEAV